MTLFWGIYKKSAILGRAMSPLNKNENPSSPYPRALY
jgi:hypothetical protein